MTATAIETQANRPTATRHGAPQSALRGMLPSILISGVLPFVLYQVLERYGVATVPALTAGAIFPVASTLVSWVRTRRTDIVGIVSLFFIVVSVATSLISGDARFTLIKESFLTGLTGLIFLGSCFAPRPMMYYFSRQFSAGGDPAAVAQWNERWKSPMVRHAIYTMNTVWGVVYIVEAMVRVALVFVLPISVFLIVSQVMVYAVIIGTIHWTVRYGKRMRDRAAAQAAQRV